MGVGRMFATNQKRIARSRKALRAFVVATVAATIGSQPVSAGGDKLASSATREIELLADPGFRQGFEVYDPTPGKKVVVGKIGTSPSGEPPAWGIAQWSSKFSLAGASPETLSDGATQYADGAKTVIRGPSGSEHADLVLAIDSRKEWNGAARKQGEPWPHLLVEQRIAPRCPPLTEVKGLRFSIDAFFKRSARLETADYDPSLHAAQFLIYFTVQNQNKDSSGYGDFLWLGVPVYDDRGLYEEKVIEGDVGLGKLIFNPSREIYTETDPQIGIWIKFEADLLPLAKKGLEEAWKRGFLKGSQNLADYTLGGMNVGWEAPGMNLGEMQVRDLRLTALVPPE